MTLWKKIALFILTVLIVLVALFAYKERYIIEGLFEETGENSPFRHKAKYYTRGEGGEVTCNLCPHECTLKKGERGLCRVRFNNNGDLYSLIFGKSYPLVTPPNYQMPITFLGLKRPWLKMGLVGCNFKCPFCVFGKHVLSKPEDVPMKYMSPEMIAKLAKDKNASVIVHGTNEPTVNYEYTLAVSKLARQKGIISVLCTNGFVNKEPLLELAKYTDAVVFGLKGFSEEMYARYTGGSLKTVLQNALLMKRQGVHVSFFYLVIPTISDSDKQIREMSSWVKSNFGELTEVYLMRYYPSYKLRNLPPTPLGTLKRAKGIAEAEGLKFAIIYLMNIHNNDDPLDLAATSVSCPFCRKRVLGYKIKDGIPVFEKNLIGNRCKYCGKDIPWSRKRSYEMDSDE